MNFRNISIISFTVEKIFTVAIPRNVRNVRLYRPAVTKKKDIAAKRACIRSVFFESAFETWAIRYQCDICQFQIQGHWAYFRASSISLNFSKRTVFECTAGHVRQLTFLSLTSIRIVRFSKFLHCRLDRKFAIREC